MTITKYFIGSLVVTLLLFSCTKSKSFDITGDPQVKFFMNNQSSGNAPQNSISYGVVNIPNVAGSGLVNLSSTIPMTIKFPVFATAPVSDDVTIGASLDNSLIAAYNTAHHTNYVAFPAGFIINTVGLDAHMTKGSTITSDSISIAVDVTKITAFTDTTYMAPIRLITVSKPGVGGITSNSATQVAYVIANVEQRRIKYLATTADIQGALLTTRTAWTALFNPAPSTVGSIFDGSATTFTRWTPPVTPFGQLDVNMQAVKNVTGLRLYHGSSSTYVPTNVDIYLSSDGINYDHIGFPIKANITFSTTYNYILFYKAIPAQYIRLYFYYSTSTNTQNGRVTEFDVYAN